MIQPSLFEAGFLACLLTLVAAIFLVDLALASDVSDVNEQALMQAEQTQTEAGQMQIKSAQPSWHADQLLFDLATRKRVLEELADIATTLETINTKAPAIYTLLAGMEGSDALMRVLDSAQKPGKPVTFEEKQRALEYLVTTAGYLQHLGNVDADTLSLLASMEGGGNLKSVLSGVISGEDIRGSPKIDADVILFAQSADEASGRIARLVLEVGNEIISLRTAQKVPTRTGFIRLVQVENIGKVRPQLQITLETEEGNIRLNYPDE